MKLRYFSYLFGLLLAVTAVIAIYLYFDRPQIVLPPEEPFQIVLDESIDWDSISIELTSILSDLIQIPTVRKDESKAALYIQKILQKEGIPSRLIPNPDRPDKMSLVAEIGPEDSLNGTVLLNHLDVVEVNESEWSEPPFSGDVKNGMIYGRGALDMKGAGTMELMAFIMIHRMDLPLRNKIMFLSVPDEESGGKMGAEFLLNNHESLFEGYQFVINEGGFGIKDFPKKNNNIFNIQTAEKGILGLELTAKGSSGHGSMPEKKYSSLEMIKMLLEVQSLQKFQLTPQSIEFFHRLGTFYEFPENFLLQRIQNPLVQKILSKKLMENHAMNAMVSNTISITNLSTDSSAPNVIPAETKAYLDIRLLPGVSPEEMTEQVQKIAQKYNITVDVKESYPASQSSAQTQFYDVLYSVLKDNVKDTLVSQYLSPGATDSRFFRAKGFQCYGIIPVMIPMEDIGMLHGKNEAISIENLKLGTKVIFETLVGFNQIEESED
jgi:acetylornithine deacetylase/succinyl-diaminopimelate desuccinylase-like protein